MKAKGKPNKLNQLLLSKIKDGDIIIFKGKAFFSKIITYRCGASHVGIVNVKNGIFRLFEANARTNVLLGHEEGCHNTPLYRKLMYYDGEIYVRRLVKSMIQKELNTFKICISRYEGKPYEKSITEFLGAAIDWIDLFKKDMHQWIFCSELVALMYMCLDYLPKVDQGGKPASEYTPGDFKDLRLINNDLLELEPLIVC